MKKVAITGGGPAGVYCALQLNKLTDAKIDIYEKNSPLKTLLATGGGRCNLSRFGDDIYDFAKNYPRGEKFLYSVFSKHFTKDTLKFFSSIGIKTYKQADDRYFPLSDSAADMREKMLLKLRANIIKKNITSLDELAGYDFIVIATGSKGGYDLAYQAGHNIIEPKPALCGLKLNPDSPKYPEGVVLDTPEGEILFTHEGISGPYIYKMSSINARRDFPYKITVPLINTVILKEAVQNNPKKSFGNIVSKFIPKSLAWAILDDFEIQCANVKKSQIENLSNITFEVISPDKKGEIVTAGGVDLKEINNKCQSKINPRIFFCGEIMDIDGFCGGYNLQSCWSTGYCAALGISEVISY